MKHWEWCSSIVIVPKQNVTVHLCLDVVWINQLLTRPVYTGPTINGILPKLRNVDYMTLIGACSSYIFQHRMDKILKDPPVVFGIADEILIGSYNAYSWDYGKNLTQVMQICWWENLKLNKKMPFHMYHNNIFWRNNLRSWVQPYSRKLHMLRCHPLIIEQNCNHFYV